MGHIERTHRDIKVGLKTNLLKMADKEGQYWTLALPWVLLGKRTQYQPELGASAAEMVYGQTLKVPGDLAGANLQPEGKIEEILRKVHRNTAREPIQTSQHRSMTTYMPPSVANATHVYVKVGKTGPLGANFDGPLKILERRGTSCVPWSEWATMLTVSREPRFTIGTT